MLVLPGIDRTLTNPSSGNETRLQPIREVALKSSMPACVPGRSRRTGDRVLPRGSNRRLQQTALAKQPASAPLHGAPLGREQSCLRIGRVVLFGGMKCDGCEWAENPEKSKADIDPDMVAVAATSSSAAPAASIRRHSATATRMRSTS